MTGQTLQPQDVTAHLQTIPHGRALGLRFHAFGDDHIEILLPYDEKLVGDPDTGVIHGGAITALLDNASGFVVRPPEADRATSAIATLDLRIDYMGPATPGRDVIARATCFKRTRTIAFVRAVAYHDSPDDPIATCTATF
ncbi:MAG: PaaI family thioesterase, partial [Acidimicrobiia bacterium]|nr:PaaI family thioesterase [Acidimicrobiia bacterium]